MTMIHSYYAISATIAHVTNCAKSCVSSKPHKKRGNVTWRFVPFPSEKTWQLVV